MEKINANPYFFFRGNAREAMEFYKNIFGGELTMRTYADVGMGQDNNKNHIMHAALEGSDITLMASDTPQASPKAAKISLSLSSSDEGRIRFIFEKLCKDVEPETPIRKEFWGDLYGQVTDKFGIEWMVTIPIKK